MNFLAAVLLLHMREEEAFWAFERVMQHYGMRTLFLPHSAELALCLHKLAFAVEDLCPKLAAHFVEQDIDIEAHTSQWLLTLFSYLFPPELTFRVWDAFFVDGFDVAIRTAVAIMKSFESEFFSIFDFSNFSIISIEF
jgi:TBC1 domain-containing protein 4